MAKTKVMINGETKEIDCDIIKLANTMWDKSGEKYTEEEMDKMGFKKKKMKGGKTKC